MQKPTMQIYSELQYAYDFFNQALFANQLPECIILLYNKEKRVCGYYSKGRFKNSQDKECDAIALNPQYFEKHNIIEVMQTIVHEMCHMWQAHFGERRSLRSYHNKEWGEKMESVGLMPSHTGKPGGKKTGQKMADYPIEGGLFLQVCERLITPEYDLSWHDRFGIKPVSTPSSGDEVTGEPLESPSNKSNRAKYTCSSCQTNVWGKHGLSIVCGECQQIFVQIQ